MVDFYTFTIWQYKFIVLISEFKILNQCFDYKKRSGVGVLLFGVFKI